MEPFFVRPLFPVSRHCRSLLTPIASTTHSGGDFFEVSSPLTRGGVTFLKSRHRSRAAGVTFSKSPHHSRAARVTFSKSRHCSRRGDFF